MQIVDEAISEPSSVQHKICCKKAIKKHIKTIERVIEGVVFQMKVCALHEDEFSEDGTEVQS